MHNLWKSGTDVGIGVGIADMLMLMLMLKLNLTLTLTLKIKTRKSSCFATHKRQKTAAYGLNPGLNSTSNSIPKKGDYVTQL